MTFCVTLFKRQQGSKHCFTYVFGISEKNWLGQLVRSRRLELPRELPHSDLNAARLPIPPRPHVSR